MSKEKNGPPIEVEIVDLIIELIELTTESHRCSIVTQDLLAACIRKALDDRGES